MTRLPSGSRSRRNPSPWCTSSGGVRSSTVRTKPGLLMGVSSSVLARSERDLDAAELAGVDGMCHGFAPPAQWVGRLDPPVDRRRAGELDGFGEVRPLPVAAAGVRRIGTDQV